MKRLIIILLAVVAVGSVYAIVPDGEPWGSTPWSWTLGGELDAEVVAALPNESFLLNLGPTGIRGRMYTDPPNGWCVEGTKEITVRFVFKNSPASGKINVGDVIVGANGKLFTKGHMFGRKSNDPSATFAGWDGPMEEIGWAIEDSQGLDGKLVLMVRKRGTTAVKDITIELEPVGRFSATWPVDCPRSTALLKKLCNFLVQPSPGMNRAHGQTETLLALMASGDPEYKAFIQQNMQNAAKQRPGPQDTGFACWGWGLWGVAMGEYYLLTGDADMATAINARVDAYRYGIDPGANTYSHTSYPVIAQRIAAGGPKGYGAMAPVGAIAMLAMSLAKEAGLKYPEDTYQDIHNSVLWECGKAAHSGGIAYGWAGKQGAYLELQNPAFSPCKSEKGYGYECPTGMKDIGPYTIAWPTKADPRWTPTDWIAAEADKNRVFYSTEKNRSVIRYRAPDPEPTGPFTTSGQNRHHLPAAYGALAHLIGNRDNASWIWLGQRLATGIANSPKSWWDGHAGAELHAFGAAFAVRLAPPETYRAWLDKIRSWMVICETHNGGFVMQPFYRDRGGTGPGYNPRQGPTAVAAMVLSVPRKAIRITGSADAAMPPIPVAPPVPAPAPAPNPEIPYVPTPEEHVNNPDAPNPSEPTPVPTPEPVPAPTPDQPGTNVPPIVPTPDQPDQPDQPGTNAPVNPIPDPGFTPRPGTPPSGWDRWIRPGYGER